jgi:hypothetical protein
MRGEEGYAKGLVGGQQHNRNLVKIDDVNKLTTDMIEEFVRRFGGFDLVIRSNPCNNLAGRTHHSRNVLEGDLSSLFYDYVGILDDVRSAMWRII